jgi:hypothetical protein
VLAIMACFEGTYLRQPTLEDIVHQMNINEVKRFLGMFGSINCMHWTWKNCLVA